VNKTDLGVAELRGGRVDLSCEARGTVDSPTFENPPVVETALGIQFDELKKIKSVHFGLLYETIRTRYPEFEDQERLEPIVESFPKAPRIAAFRLKAGPTVDRVWYRNVPDGPVLVQVQPDRFGFNWRKVDGKSPYPRFSENSHKCLDEFRLFSQFCKEHDLGEIRPNLCEVVYVNHIWPAENEVIIDLFPRVFSGIDFEHSDDWLPKPETVSFNRTFLIGEQEGRLYAEASVARHRERGDFILLKMTGRVLHEPDTTVADTLQRAHDWVVRGFVGLTNESIRKEQWGQTS
jgi:uncharacterized protein (TIGR04255 family)